MSRFPESLSTRNFPDGTIILYREDLQKRVPDEIPINEVWIRQDYTPPGFDIEKSDMVIDIGAHIGAFTIYSAKRAGGGFVYSYEPSPINFAILQRNVAINSLTNVHLCQMAIASDTTSRQLTFDETNDAGASFFSTGGVTELVHCIRLEDIFEANAIARCGFLKMDCEGAEYEILFSTPPDIFKRIRRIALEYHVRSQIPNCDPNALIDFLKGHGYVVVKNKPKTGLGILCVERKF
ncbi:hypothetical protein COT03_02835 [Candidatus Shapirobacteria bacterium CG07_land_8_20_14_0_80_39_18]|uniref:Methyltransferase FkbM domain-containing protein n=1 Tax=Candidatus Shapirobacteria bacterium CG07_land_8_20_14_0_80_39_18 TaxID=1974882 RepID=A0A2M6YQU7_9BACT|nr:MAG: hypothetical protein COT03_02835 [Candidatus Shapirobacteria bacterium CG07_land_8_20_14_0_80_39_18]